MTDRSAGDEAFAWKGLKVQKADVHGKGESSGGGSGGGSGCVAMFGRADEAVAR